MLSVSERRRVAHVGLVALAQDDVGQLHLDRQPVRQRDALGFRRDQRVDGVSAQLLRQRLADRLHQFGIAENVQNRNPHTRLDRKQAQIAFNPRNLDRVGFVLTHLEFISSVKCS